MEAFRRKYKDERFLKLIEIAILNYQTKQDILDEIDEEERKKARRTDRRLYKSADRELRVQPDSPPDEGRSPGEVLPPVL